MIKWTETARSTHYALCSGNFHREANPKMMPVNTRMQHNLYSKLRGTVNTGEVTSASVSGGGIAGPHASESKVNDAGMICALIYCHTAVEGVHKLLRITRWKMNTVPDASDAVRTSL